MTLNNMDIASPQEYDIPTYLNVNIQSSSVQNVLNDIYVPSFCRIMETCHTIFTLHRKKMS